MYWSGIILAQKFEPYPEYNSLRDLKIVIYNKFSFQRWLRTDIWNYYKVASLITEKMIGKVNISKSNPS